MLKLKLILQISLEFIQIALPTFERQCEGDRERMQEGAVAQSKWQLWRERE